VLVLESLVLVRVASSFVESQNQSSCIVLKTVSSIFLDCRCVRTFTAKPQ